MKHSRKKIQLIWALALSLFVTPAWSVISVNKFWIPLSFGGNYGGFYYFLEPQMRLIERNNIFDEFLLNAAVGFEMDRGLRFYFGQAITTVAQDANPLSQEEYRMWEQLIYNYETISGIKINSRFRVEERKSFNFPQWGFRMRERLIVNFPLTNNMSYELSNEILYNLNSVPWIETTSWDQNRAYVAVVQRFSDHYAFAVGYMSQYLFRRFARSDHVLYLNFRFNLPT